MLAEFYADIYFFIVIFCCLLLSAFFSASETAITSIGTLKARHLVEVHGKKSPLNLWLQKPHHVLTTILVYNNLVNILASVIATYLATKYFKSGALGVATGSITFLILVFGEIIPKSFAKIYSEKISMFSINFIRIFYYVSYPIIWALAELAIVISKWIGGADAPSHFITEDEIEFIINDSENHSVIEDTKRDMISSVFEFHETKVREIMTPRTDLIALDSDEAKFVDAINIVLQSGHSRIPVYKNQIDHIIGIILAKDLLAMQTKNPGNNMALATIMRKPFFVPESKPLMEVFKELRNTKNHIAIVVDEYGGTAGVVTMEDILEEIVGDIQDEHDKEEAEIIELSKDSYDVAGSVNLEEFFDHFKLKEDKEDEEDLEKLSSEFDTLGGWVTNLIGDMPKVGQKISYGPLTMEVSAVDHHRIKRIRLKIRSEESATATV